MDLDEFGVARTSVDAGTPIGGQRLRESADQG